MQNKCNWCDQPLAPFQLRQVAKQYVTHSLCADCTEMIFQPDSTTMQKFLDSLDAPILLMQAEPRKVVGANRQACELFAKELSQIEGRRSGEVFDCVHAASEAGCGKDAHCEKCGIKKAVDETFASGNSFDKVATFLKIRKNHDINLYNLQVSTEKAGDLTLLRIDQFLKKD